MCMHVCMCVCMYVCLYVRMYACMYARVCRRGRRARPPSWVVAPQLANYVFTHGRSLAPMFMNPAVVNL